MSSDEQEPARVASVPGLLEDVCVPDESSQPGVDFTADNQLQAARKSLLSLLRALSPIPIQPALLVEVAVYLQPSAATHPFWLAVQSLDTDPTVEATWNENERYFRSSLIPGEVDLDAQVRILQALVHRLSSHRWAVATARHQHQFYGAARYAYGVR